MHRCRPAPSLSHTGAHQDDPHSACGGYWAHIGRHPGYPPDENKRIVSFVRLDISVNTSLVLYVLYVGEYCACIISRCHLCVLNGISPSCQYIHTVFSCIYTFLELTFFPACLRASASSVVMVLLPTPPLPDSTNTTCRTWDRLPSSMKNSF